MALGKCRECGREVSKEAKACPGCGVAKPVKPSISWVRILLGVVAVIVGVRVCASTGDKAAATAAAVPSPTVAAENLDKLSAAALLQAYTANEIAADAKYKGKRFKITGTVAAIKSDITDDPQVWLGSELNPVIANGIRKGFAATLSKGDRIESACTVSGSIMGTPTLDCSGPQ